MVIVAVPSPVGLPGVQLYVYGKVPPLAVTAIVPLQFPLHVTFVDDPGAIRTFG